MWRIVEDNTKVKTWLDTETNKSITIKKVMLGRWIVVQSDIGGKLGPVTKEKAEQIVQRIIGEEKIKSLGLGKVNKYESETA